MYGNRWPLSGLIVFGLGLALAGCVSQEMAPTAGTRAKAQPTDQAQPLASPTMDRPAQIPQPSPSQTSEPPASATPTALPPTPDTVIPEDLVAYYAFDGDGSDLSGNGNHAQVRLAVATEDRNGKADGAYLLDGQGAYLEVADSESLDLTFEMSISVWLLYVPQEKPTFYTILEKGDPERGGHARWGLWLIGDRAEFCVQPASLSLPQSCLDGDTALQPETWHHIAGTFDGSTLRLYIDGLLSGERDFPQNAVAQNNFPLYIGTDPFNSDVLYTRGVIDELRIYKRVLSGAEMLTLFQFQP